MKNENWDWSFLLKLLKYHERDEDTGTVYAMKIIMWVRNNVWIWSLSKNGSKLTILHFDSVALILPNSWMFYSYIRTQDYSLFRILNNKNKI